MTLIAVAAGKGSPGVSITALVLAAVWPRPAVLAECDPSGGDLVFTLRREGGDVLAGDRGIVSLATALRVPGAATEVLAHAQMADGGLPVLVGVEGERIVLRSHMARANSQWRDLTTAVSNARKLPTKIPATTSSFMPTWKCRTS